MIQETLEEAILRIKSENEHYIDEVAFELGAKWQQERSYSEEELLEVVTWYLDDFLDDAIGLNGEEAEKKVEHLKSGGLTKEVLKYWFEQFKK